MTNPRDLEFREEYLQVGFYLKDTVVEIVVVRKLGQECYPC
ncbi:hypothetical protein M0804_014213 [Polistes exclamans]|nr:hypothetical protein M0804_014213 [Polistes exclamans]